MVNLLVAATEVTKFVTVVLTVVVDEKRTVMLTSWASAAPKKGFAPRDLQIVFKLLI